jgi:formate transporter
MAPLRDEPRETAAPENHEMDALMPGEMAFKAEKIGVEKASMDALRLFTLAVLAGAFIGFGAMFATTVGAGAGELPYGIVRLLSGVVFSLGLILVIIGGAELFTGNALIVMAWAARLVSGAQLLRNWTIVFLGNFVGAVCIAAIIFAGNQHGFGGGAVGATALAIAEAKSALGFGQALALGIVCNTLVCLAVWLCYSAHSVISKIAALTGPIAAFVAGGFEHSIANMYFIPMGLFIKYTAPESFWTAIGRSAADYPHLTPAGFGANLLPVTIGNIIGGGALVGAVYWFVYLRKR